MSTLIADLPALRAALLFAVPLVYALAALPSSMASSLDFGWRWARLGAGLALAASLASLAWLIFGGPGIWRGPALFGADAGVHFSLRSDALADVMLVLVCFIGWVIVGYSQTYLGGQRGQPRYIRSLMLTLAAVTVLVLTNNLLLLVLAWIGTSLALHALLTFFEQRPQALIAAHKKFLASRLADVCMLGAIALVGSQLGTFEIDTAVAAARALPELSGGLQLAAVLFVIAALLKCAQLPVHGWLIQVMEAPTPVSALLHAGVVNLGGFVMIRLGTLVADVPAAQTLLVVVGGITAVVAASTMMTRISIKVALAWSTCAQMGFMLMQCGLGLYDLALLHIVAHSLYKAHAFLTAGTAVEQHRLQQMTPPLPTLSGLAWFISAIVGIGIVAAAALAWGIQPAEAPALWAMSAILALALVPLLAGPLLHAGGAWMLAGLAGSFAVALVYFGLHLLFKQWLGSPSAASMGLVAWVIGCFVVLFVIAALLKCAQLPVHGWLIQVMEAPTPVSALLHAGVVNLGGFVMIRLGTLVADVPAAQALLVVVGGITAVVAASTMMTRISIKVALAWSTCAQMGFMLMQCGLGLYDLALLHIVAHSLYKAHAFLTAGTAVEQHRLQQMTPPLPPLSGLAWFSSAIVGIGIVAAAALAWGIQPAEAPALWAMSAILALALVPLLAGPLLHAGGAWMLAGLAGSFAVALVYFGLHLLFKQWLGSASAAPMGLVAWVIGCFVVLFVVQGAVRARPQGALSRRLYPWLYAGLYLDEIFTRLTFRVWPARLPSRPAAAQPIGPEAQTPGAL